MSIVEGIDHGHDTLAYVDVLLRCASTYVLTPFFLGNKKGSHELAQGTVVRLQR
jgi:hypothetical protein